MTGYRFSANSAASGGVGGSIVSAGQQTCGPEYARGMDPAGEGGVETFPHCYGLPSYCGWQQVAGSQNVLANTAGQITVVPTVSPYFEPKAAYFFGIDAAAPGTNVRFTISDVSVGGAPQLAISGAATGAAGAAELLSDCFNRTDEPVLISWAIFSTVALARQLTVDVFNINGVAIDIWVAIWGNARDSLPPLRPAPPPPPAPGPVITGVPAYPVPGPTITGVPAYPVPPGPVITGVPVVPKTPIIAIPAYPKEPTLKPIPAQVLPPPKEPTLKPIPAQVLPPYIPVP